MATKSEILSGLSPELQTAYTDDNQCFGKEFDGKDDTCIKECNDVDQCKAVFEAEPDTAPPAEEPKATEEKPVTEDVKKPEAPEASETDQAPPEPAQAEAPAEKPQKEKPAGFGDRTASKDEFGFTLNTKGSYIVQLLKVDAYSKADLVQMANDEYNADSTGRVNMVLYRTRERGYPLMKAGKKYYLDGITPVDKVNAAKAAAEKEANAKKEIAAAAAAKKKEAAEKKKAEKTAAPAKEEPPAPPAEEPKE